MAIEKGLKRASDIVRHVLYGEERKANHHLDHLSVGELAVGFLFESHLPFRDVYGSRNVHYPLCAESAATFCEKIAQLRNLRTISETPVHRLAYIYDMIGLSPRAILN